MKVRITEENVRYCLFDSLGHTIALNRSTLTGIYGDGPKFTGPLSEPYNWMISAGFGFERYNYSSVLKTSYGKLNEKTGLYDPDSCLHSMQTNESDCAIMYQNTPVVAEELRQHTPYIDDYVIIMSKYKITDQSYAYDFMQSFTEVFQREVLAILMAFLVIFMLISKCYIWMENENIRINSRINRRWKKEKKNLVRDDTFYEVLTHFFQVESIDYKMGNMQFISLLVTFLSFYTLTYFSNMISTDLVLVKEPFIIRSYEDLLKSKGGVILVFNDMQDTVSNFENAPPGSTQNLLWEKALKTVKGDRSKLFLNLAHGDIATPFAKIAEAVRSTTIEIVGVFSRLVAIPCRATACMLKVAFVHRELITDGGTEVHRELNKLFSRISKDDNEKPNIMSSVFRKGFNSPLAKRINKRLTNLYETGTYVYLINHQINRPALQNLKIKDPQEADVYNACMTDDYRINIPNHPTSIVSMINYKYILCTCIFITSMASLALCMEKKQKARKNRRIAPVNRVLQVTRFRKLVKRGV